MLADFYQLSRDPVERILPVIAGRILSDGGRLLVVSQSAEQRGAISDALWNHAPESFLAHGDADGDRPQVQPILLSAVAQADNGARNIALADGIWRQEEIGRAHG